MPDQANQPVLDNDLVVAAMAWLRERLPASWTVEPSPIRAGGNGGLADSAVDVRGGNAVSTIIIETRRSMRPRDVERLLGGLGRKLRQHAPYFNVLVVAPWLSRR